VYVFPVALASDISIHVSARETTMFGFHFFKSGIYFNPRLRKGDDITCLYSLSVAGNFNPRLRKGDDGYNSTLEEDLENFNPRLRKGDDRGMDS